MYREVQSLWPRHHHLDSAIVNILPHLLYLFVFGWSVLKYGHYSALNTSVGIAKK